jgi:hypothetical protein
MRPNCGEQTDFGVIVLGARVLAEIFRARGCGGACGKWFTPVTISKTCKLCSRAGKATGKRCFYRSNISTPICTGATGWVHCPKPLVRPPAITGESGQQTFFEKIPAVS